MTPRPFHRLLLLQILAVVTMRGQETPPMIPFPFSPAQHLNAICLPDDWLKTLVTERGALAYDFGPGPYARPLTEISFGLDGTPLTVTRQFYEDPVVPIAVTLSESPSVRVVTRAFSLIPRPPEHSDVGPGNDRLKHPGGPPAKEWAGFRIGDDRVTRRGGINGAMAWCAPPPYADPAFRNVAWGTNRPITYHVSVTPGAARRVAFGLCESYKQRPGGRSIELRVEGGDPLTVDPLVDGERNRPYVYLVDGSDRNNDGVLEIGAWASPRSSDPNVLLNVIWMFPAGAAVTPDGVMRGVHNNIADVRVDCGRELEASAPSPRLDALRATFDGADATPVIRIRSPRELSFDSARGLVLFEHLPYCLSRPAPLSAMHSGDTLVLLLPRGTRSADLIVVHGGAGRSEITGVPPLDQELARTDSFWRGQSSVPRGRLRVPDPRLQYLVDASIRNVYQIRDVVDGGLQYQPGPTVYRGLWIGDVLFSGNTSLMLGDYPSVRRALDAALPLQSLNGQFRVLLPVEALAETPIVLLAVCRYAEFSGDTAWLRRHWQVVRRGMTWIRNTRGRTLADGSAPYAGLMPPGFVDGGISHLTADYGTLWWAMIALQEGAAAAFRIGYKEDARSWESLLDSFWIAFRARAPLDMRTDSAGYRYLPVAVADTMRGVPPQRGQYAFLLPLPYGRFFQSRDTLMQAINHGNLAMLDSRTDEGIIAGSGWLQDGIWAWLGGVHAMAHHRMGHWAKAWEALQAFADHATPLGTWVEEQQPQGKGTRTTGDASNAEAGAFFVQTVRNLLVCERADTLAFLAGFPQSWLGPGKQTLLRDGGTTMGNASLEVSVSTDGKTATLALTPPSPGMHRCIPVLYCHALRDAGFLYADGKPLPQHLPLKAGQQTILKLMKKI